jgi:membrane-bound metal-dependent hydrolase YbcI (DUF457 family)
MDPVTHAVIGRSLDYLRKPGASDRGRGLAAVLGALSPDIDAVLMPIGFDRYLVAHEVGTHAAVGVVVCAGLTAALTRLLRGGDSRQQFVAALIGASSHVMADLSAGATVRIGWPLIDARVGNLGTFAMGDPVIVGICAAAAVLLWRWPARRRAVAVALVATLAVGIGVKSGSRIRALATYHAINAAVAVDGPPLIEPVSGTFSTWRMFDRTNDVVRAWTFEASGRAWVLDFTIPRIPAAPSSLAALAASKEWETVRNLRRAHDFTFAVVEPTAEPEVLRVLWSDVRYCDTASRCAIRAGGDWSAAGLRQLVVHVGEWTQLR